MKSQQDEAGVRSRTSVLLSLILLSVSLGSVLGCRGSGAAGTEEGESTASTGSESLPEAPRVTGAEARTMVANGAMLLDVTPHARAERSFIDGRTHIPFTELAERMGELPRDRDIVVYCLGGGASPRAGAQLRAAGYRAFVMGAKTNWDR
jgi:rhodanese-related sulfurtransferase